MKTYFYGTCTLCHRSVRKPLDGDTELVRSAGKLIAHKHKKEYTIRRPDDEEDSDSWVDHLHRMGGKRYGLL